MSTNPNIPQTPCHRVVASDGKLTGYSAKEGLKTKQEMLTEEGIRFVGNRVDLKTSLWQTGII
jgi:alkylated DNA nucleotide flippase Atl1